MIVSKTVRFRNLVRVSGRRQAATLWVEPKKDPIFSKAIRERRVLTIRSDPKAHRKDYGLVGFQKQPGATYMIFPKPLLVERASRIIGIDYNLAVEPAVNGPMVSQWRKNYPKRKKVWASKPPKRSFDVVVRQTATMEQSLRIKASTEEEARTTALARANRKRLNLSRSVQKAEVLSLCDVA
jgi:hypothetical protein